MTEEEQGEPKVYRTVGDVQAAIQGMASASEINMVEITPGIQRAIDNYHAPKPVKVKNAPGNAKAEM